MDVKGGRMVSACVVLASTDWIRAQLSHLFLKIQSRWQALEGGT